jgi:hypothetical protein
LFFFLSFFFLLENHLIVFHSMNHFFP